MSTQVTTMEKSTIADRDYSTRAILSSRFLLCMS